MENFDYLERGWHWVKTTHAINPFLMCFFDGETLCLRAEKNEYILPKDVYFIERISPPEEKEKAIEVVINGRKYVPAENLITGRGVIEALIEAFENTELKRLTDDEKGRLINNGKVFISDANSARGFSVIGFLNTCINRSIIE